MRIKKYGHSCLLVTEGDLVALIDPGNYNPVPDAAGIDVILITHEHDDHCFLPALAQVLQKNPHAEIITHAGVGKKLGGRDIKWTPIQDGESIERKGVSIASYGTEHAIIHPDIPRAANTGFLIASRLFYPGDALHQPPVSVEILALPAFAPWMRIEEAIEYGRRMKPAVAFPVHDGILAPGARGLSSMLFPKLLAPAGVEFRAASEGEELAF